jgi:hypothetical protein
MRISTAYFAGVGTVVAAVAAGLGGGYLAANVVNPHEPGVSKLERRMSATPIPTMAAPSEPVPRIAGITAAATSPAAAPPQTEPQQTFASQTPVARTSATQTPANPEQIAASNASVPAEAKTASNTPRSVQSVPAKPAEQAGEKAVVEKTAAPQEAFARARDADIKRAAVEKRRAERRQRFEEQRRYQQPREQELEAVEEKVREITEPRQAFAVERVRTETPRIRLFDLD